MAEFECRRCGWCCKNVNINVSYSDILRWSKENRLDILNEISYIDHEDESKRGFYIEKTVLAPKRACPFLEETTCTIHDTEPRACAEFPEAFNKDEKEKIECPVKWDTVLTEEEIFELKKEQAFDFVLAEDRKEKIIRILEIAKTIFEGQRILKEFGEDPTEQLAVSGLGSERSGWTEVGGAPYLEFQDEPTNYIWTTTKKAEHGDFVFYDTAHGLDTLNSVTLYVYHKNVNEVRVLEYHIWDGTGWTEYNLTPGTSYSWQNIAVPVLDTWIKVDGAKLYIKQPNQADRTDVDAAYLLCDYTTAGDTYEKYISDSISVSDTEYISTEFLKEVCVSDTINVSDSIGIEHIYEIIDTYASDSVNVSDDVITETYKFFTSSMGDFIDVGDGVTVEKIEAGAETKNVYVSDSIIVDDDLLLKGVTKTWNAPSNGNWETASNWLPIGVPQEGDKVIFNATSTYTCGINGNTENLESFLMDTGYTGTLSLNSYTLYIENTADTSSLTGTQGTLDAGSGLIKVSGDWDTASTNFIFTRGTSTVVLTGAGNIYLRSTTTYAFYSLTCGQSGNTTTLQDSIGVYNLLIVGTGSVIWNGIILRGTTTNPPLQCSGSISSTVRYAVTGQIIASMTYGGLVEMAPGASGSFTLDGAVTAGSIRIWGGGGTATLNTNNYAMTITTGHLRLGNPGVGTDYGVLNSGTSTIDFNGTGDAVVIENTDSYVTSGAGTWTCTGNWYSESTHASHDMGTTIVTFDGAPTQTITTGTTSRAELYTMKIANSTTVQLLSNLSIGGNFGDGADDGEFQPQTYTIYVEGDCNVSSSNFTLTYATSTFDLTGDGTLTAYNDVQRAFFNLKVAAPGKTTTVTTDTRQYGVLTTGTGTLVQSGPCVMRLYSGTETDPFVNGGGSMTIDLMFAPEVSYNIPAGTNYYRLTVATLTTDYSVTATLQGTTAVSDRLWLHYYGRLNTGNQQLTVGNLEVGYSDAHYNGLTCGSSTIDINGYVIIRLQSWIKLDTSVWTVSGGWDNNSVNVTWDEGTSVVEFDGDSTQTIANLDQDFYDLKLSGTGQKNFTESFKTHDVRALNNVTMKITHTTPTWTTFNSAAIYADATYTLTLRSSSDDTQWLMSAGTGVVATRVDVMDSNNSGTEVDATDPSNTNSGNNDGWNFVSGEVKDVAVSDAVEVTDGLVVIIYKFFTSSVADFIDIGDSVYVEKIEAEPIDVYVSDTANVSDSVFVEKLFLKEAFASDSIDVSDDVVVEHIYEIINKYVSDTIDVSDSISKEKVSTFDKAVSDDIEVSDSVFTSVEEGLFILDPDSDTSPNDWDVVGATNHFDAVDDAVRQPSVPTWDNYVTTTTAAEHEEYGFEDAPTSVGTVVKIKVWTYANVGDNDDSIEITPNIAGTWSPVTKKIYPDQLGSWEYVEWTGLEIDLTDINSLQIDYESVIEDTSGNLWRITCTYVEVTYEPWTTKIVSDSIDVSDAVQISTTKTKYVSDSIDVSDSVVVEHIYEIIDKYVLDSIDVSDSVTIEHIYEIIDKYVSDVIDVSDAVTTEHIYEIIEKYVSDAVNVSDSQTIEHIWEVLTKRVGDAVEVSDSVATEHIYEIIEKALSDTVNVSDSIFVEKVTEFDRYVSDDIDVSDSVEVEYVPWKTVEVYVSDAVEVSDAIRSGLAVPTPDKVKNAMFILIAGTSTITVSDDMNQATIRYATNEIPTAKFTLNDKDGKYTTMSGDMIVGNQIIISGSTNAGKSWARLFSGSIRDIGTTVSPKGELVGVQASDNRLIRNLTDFNNSIYQYSDFGKLFTGSEKHGEWYYYKDYFMNYPNGLLHNSGLTYSGPDVIYSEVTDLPDSLIFNHQTLFSVTKRFCDVFAMSFFLSAYDEDIRFVSNSVDYPTFSGATISYGVDINKSSMRQDYSKFADRVIVHGKGLFYQTQKSDKKAWEVEYDSWVPEENLHNPFEAKQLSEMYLEKYSESINKGSLVVSPYTYSVLGKRISVNDPKHGWTGMGNVVGITHNITPDRWTTAIDIDNKIDIPEQTLAESLEKIEKLKEKKDYELSHDGFLYMDWDWPTESHEHFSDQGGQVNESITRTSSDDVQYPCILAIGKNSVHTWSDVNIKDKLYTYVLSDYMEDDSYFFRVGSNFPTTTNNTSTNPLLKEFVVYFYTDSVAPIYHDIDDLSRPTTPEGWAGTWNEHTLGDEFPGNDKSYLMVPPPEVYVEGASFRPMDGGVDIRVSWQDYTSASEDNPYYALLITDSEWTVDGGYYRPTQGEKITMSYDDGIIPTKYFSYTHTVGANDEYVKFKTDVRLGLDQASMDLVRMLHYNIVARVKYTRAGESTESQWWELWTGRKRAPYGWEWMWEADHSAPVGDWGSASLGIAGADLTDDVVFDGKLSVTLAPFAKCKAATDVVFDIEYFDCGYEMFTDSDKYYKIDVDAKISTDGQYLILPYDAPEKITVWADSNDGWFTDDKRILMQYYNHRQEGNRVYLTDRLKSNPVEPFPGVPDARLLSSMDWNKMLRASFEYKWITAGKKYPQIPDEMHYYVKMLVKKDQLQLPITKYTQGIDFEYFISPSFSENDRDKIIWHTSSESGNVYPRRPAYGVNYTVECPYLDHTMVTTNRYRFLKKEGYSKDYGKTLVVQFRYDTTS